MNIDDMKARRERLLAELAALPSARTLPPPEARRVHSRREEIEADLANLKRKIKAWNTKAAQASKSAADERRKNLSAEERVKQDEADARKDAAAARRAAALCEGCREGYPEPDIDRETGAPIHEGPEFRFRCRAFMPVRLTRGETIQRHAKAIQRLIAKIPADKLEGHTIDLAAALSTFVPAQAAHIKRRAMELRAPGASSADWEGVAKLAADLDRERNPTWVVTPDTIDP